MPGKPQKIVWVDVESTGLDARVDNLLQIAVRITDENLDFIDGDGFERKVYYPAEEVARMRESAFWKVQQMHDETGLWDALPTEGIPLQQLELELLDHITTYVPEPFTSRLAGNSLYLDKDFIRTYLPSLSNHLHYRAFDVSTVVGLWELKHGEEGMYVKNPTHEAMDDITESVKELRHYMPGLFPNGLADLN